MNNDSPAFRFGVVRPGECLKEGWQLVRDRFWLFVGIALVGMLIGGAAPLGILLGPMLCGIYFCLFRQSRGETVKFEMLFRGFDYFVQSLIATLIMLIPGLILAMLGMILYVAGIIAITSQPGGKPDPSVMTGFLIGVGAFVLVAIAVQVVVTTFFFFTFPLIVDKKMSGVEAIKTSFKAARANLGGVVGLVLLTMLLDFVGALACYVGWFLFLPIHFAAAAVAYKQVFGGEIEDSEPPRTPEQKDYMELDDK